MITICISDKAFATACGALEYSAKRATALGAPETAKEFRDAQAELNAAFVRSITDTVIDMNFDDAAVRT